MKTTKLYVGFEALSCFCKCDRSTFAYAAEDTWGLVKLDPRQRKYEDVLRMRIADGCVQDLSAHEGCLYLLVSFVYDNWTTVFAFDLKRRHYRQVFNRTFRIEAEARLYALAARWAIVKDQTGLRLLNTTQFEAALLCKQAGFHVLDPSAQSVVAEIDR